MVNTKESMKYFCQLKKDDSNYPLKTRVIAGAQQQDNILKEYFSTQLVKNIKVICKDGKMVIPKSLQNHVVAWFPLPPAHQNQAC